MIVTFDTSKNMMSETIRFFKTAKDLPQCRHCGTKLSYDQSIQTIFCRGKLNKNISCWSKNGNDYPDSYNITNMEDISKLKDFSKYCQSLKPYIKDSDRYKLNITFPKLMATRLLYSNQNGMKNVFHALIQFCDESTNDNIPYLSQIVESKLYYPELTEDEIAVKIYEQTKDPSILPESIKDIFVF